MKKFIAIPLIFCLLMLCSCTSIKVKKETAHDTYGIAYDSITIKGPGVFMEKALVITEDMNGGKVYEVAPYAFFRCKTIESLKATGWFSIHDNAFAECENLKTVTIDGLYEINKNAFYNCKNLEEINITCHSIGDHAFSSCKNLNKVTIGGHLEGVAIFGGCTKLETISINGGVLNHRCLSSDVKHIIIGSTIVKRQAFFNCNNLESVTCTTTDLSLDREAFFACEKNITITYPGTKTVFKDRTARQGLTTITGGDITVKCTDGNLYY